MLVSIELSDGTIAMWTLDFDAVFEGSDPELMESQTLDDIVAIIGEPDSIKA